MMTDTEHRTLLRRIDRLLLRIDQARRESFALALSLRELGEDLRKALECGVPAVCPDGTKLFCNARKGHEGLHADGNWDGGQLLYDDEGRIR